MASVTDDPLAGAVVTPLCPYCGHPTAFQQAGTAGADSARSRRFIYICVPCGAWVGCHPGDIRPLGTPAKEDLRALRIQAHIAFDAMRSKVGMSRRVAYFWLSAKMGLSKEECHIGMFNEVQCEEVIALSIQRSLQG